MPARNLRPHRRAITGRVNTSHRTTSPSPDPSITESIVLGPDAARLCTAHAPTQPALHRRAMRHHPSCLIQRVVSSHHLGLSHGRNRLSRWPSPPTPSSCDTIFFLQRVPSRWRCPLPFIPGLLDRLPRLKHPRGSRPQSLSSRPRRPGPPPSSTSTSSAGPLPFVRLSLVPTETSGDKQTATSWLNSSRLHAP